jgi:hypothetical protein
MAKIRLKLGQNEVEIESRDFYIDNDTAGQVIAELTTRLEERSAVQEPVGDIRQTYQDNVNYLQMLKDAEVHEPEFSEPIPVSSNELPLKIEILENDSFFAKPRTVSETVEQLREYGWRASPLDVAKVLAKMVFHRELGKNLQDNKTFYFKQLIA